MRETTSAAAPKVIVATRCADERATIEAMLAPEDCDVTSVGDGATVMPLVHTMSPQILLTAVELPGMDGLEICHRIRLRGSTLPIGMVTNKGGERLHVRCLDAGADDFISLPVVGPDEFRARVRALIRRSGADSSPTVLVNDVQLDTKRRMVTRAGEVIELTLTEYTVLELLMRNADVVLERAVIYERIWGADLHQSSKALEVHIGALRRKLECYGERVIHNVHGVGYVIWRATQSNPS